MLFSPIIAFITAVALPSLRITTLPIPYVVLAAGIIIGGWLIYTLVACNTFKLSAVKSWFNSCLAIWNTITPGKRAMFIWAVVLYAVLGLLFVSACYSLITGNSTVWVYLLVENRVILWFTLAYYIIIAGVIWGLVWLCYCTINLCAVAGTPVIINAGEDLFGCFLQAIMIPFIVVIICLQKTIILRVSFFCCLAITWLVDPTCVFQYLNSMDSFCIELPVYLNSGYETALGSWLVLEITNVICGSRTIWCDSPVEWNVGQSHMLAWHDTPSSQASRVMLNSQYEYSQIHYPELYQYLTDNCQQMYHAPIKDTGISSDSLGHNAITSGQYPNITQRISSELIKAPNNGMAGIYVIYHPQSGNAYVGSSINLKNRLVTHYQIARGSSDAWSIKRLYAQFKESGFAQFIYAQPHFTVNHYNAFITANPNMLNNPQINYMRVILDHHSSYECRLIEQAIIRWTAPSLNAGEVSFFVDWNPSDVFQSKGKPVHIRVLNTNTIFEFDSIRSAAEMSNTAITTLKARLNTTITWESPRYGQVVFFQPGMPITEGLQNGSKYSVELQRRFQHLPLLDCSVNYSQLEPGKVYVYDDAFQLLDVYEGFKPITLHYHVSSARLNAHVNRALLAVSFPVAARIFVAINPATVKTLLNISSKITSRRTVCLNLNTNTAIVYSSIQNCGRAIGRENCEGWWRIKHLIKGQVYSPQPGVDYRLFYEEDYKGPTPSEAK